MVVAAPGEAEEDQEDGLVGQQQPPHRRLLKLSQMPAKVNRRFVNMDITMQRKRTENQEKTKELSSSVRH